MERIIPPLEVLVVALMFTTSLKRKLAYPMNSSAPMVSRFSPSLSMGEQCIRHELHKPPNNDNLEGIQSAPPLTRFKRQIVLLTHIGMENL